jgi:two-component sensor histidine kinase
MALLSPFDSLRRRLAILFAVVLLPPTALSLYFAWSAFELQIDKARLSVRQYAILVSAYERDYFRDIQRLLTTLAAEPSIKQMDVTECREVLGRALEGFPEYVSISASDPGGTVICTTAATARTANVADRTWFRDVLVNRGFTISDYTVSQNSGEPVIVAASPIRDAGSEIRGVVHIDIDLDWLSLFVRGAGLPAEGTLFLLDKNGTILASPKYSFEPSEGGLPESATLRQVVQRKLIDFEAIGNDGQKRVYSSVDLPHGNVLVLFGLPSASTLGWIERDLVTRSLSLVAIWLAGVFAAGIGTRLWVTRWISQLVRTARAYSAGDFSARVRFERAPAELRDLGATLVNMAERIDEREEDLRKSLDQKEILLKEIHHRVKNNLQTISSLLNIHIRAVESEDTRKTLEEVQTRVRALALVHRYLYESEDVRQVGLKLFVGELCQVLYETLSGAKHRITIAADVDDLTIASERVVPVALLITEAITNTFKHAFPDDGPGQIRVVMRRLDDMSASLSISDDGVGCGEEDAKSATDGSAQGLGMSLISAFARQIGEGLQVSGPPGTTISLRVWLEPKLESKQTSTEFADREAVSDRTVDLEPTTAPVPVAAMRS